MPLLHSPDIPVSKRFSSLLRSSSSMVENNEAGSPSAEVFQDQAITKSHLMNQSELNDRVRDSDMTKEKLGVLGSRLELWNLLQSDVKITIYRKHSINYLLSKENGLVFLPAIYGAPLKEAYDEN